MGVSIVYGRQAPHQLRGPLGQQMPGEGEPAEDEKALPLHGRRGKKNSF